MKLIPKLIIALLLTGKLAYSQDDEYVKQDKKDTPPKKEFWSKDRIVYGGDMGLLFGSITFINLSPTIGYKVTNRYIPGVGINYLYYRDNRMNFETSIYGGSIFNRFYVMKFLFLHAEYQILNGKFDYYLDRFNIHNVWVGAGISRSILGAASLNLLVLFNLNETEYSFPASPWIRGGIGIGF